MAAIDAAAQESYALPSTVLMENAGIKLYQGLRRCHERELAAGPTVFLVGKGNNGGDALVMARQAVGDQIDAVSLVILTDELNGDPAVHLASCRALGIPSYRWPSDEARTAVETASLIVDGLYGTGIRGALHGSGADLVSEANVSSALRVAIDVPSGLGDEFEAGYPAFDADTTLTVELPKRCLYIPAARRFCGDIEIVPIGFPKALLVPDDGEAELVDWSVFPLLVPPAPEWWYKTKRGVVGVFAGAVGTSGAAVLSSLGCARSRAGLVHLIVDEAIYPVMASQLSSVLVHPRPAGTPELGSYTALVLGPGWGRAVDRMDVLRHAAASGLPGVLDADGLNVLAQHRSSGGEMRFYATWVLTPHPGECARLTGVPVAEILADPVPHCRALAKEMKAVVVLKSHVTFVVPPEGRVRIVDGMNAALGTGGSGDVLAGIIGALLGGGVPAEDAAVGGVLIHAEAGRRCRASSGWFLAEDLPLEVGRLFDEART